MSFGVLPINVYGTPSPLKSTWCRLVSVLYHGRGTMGIAGVIIRDLMLAGF